MSATSPTPSHLHKLKQTSENREVRVHRSEKGDHHVTSLFKSPSVSMSGFYARREREPSKRARQDARLNLEIAAIFHQRQGL